MIGKLGYGVPSKHILASKGGDSDVMKFYCTTNETTYGKRWENFKPRPTQYSGSGYISNSRPTITYNASLDQIDNPNFGRMLYDNYDTVTWKSYRPYTLPDGTEQLPSDLKQNAGSGFIREKVLSVPSQNDVYKVAVNTRTASAPADILPRRRPLLHQIQPKDPVEAENHGYGPAFMSTETQERFRAHPLPGYGGSRPTRRPIVGKPAETGFTHNIAVEPLGFHPDRAYVGDAPGWMTDRPTGVSITKTHYLPFQYTKGTDALPKLAVRSERDTGFTSSINTVSLGKDHDPLRNISVTKSTYLGKQGPDMNQAGLLRHVTVGDRESTGHTKNNEPYVGTADDPLRFLTHYQTQFYDRTPKGVDREGHTWGGVQPALHDGFTRNTELHPAGPDINTPSVMRNLEPYVARSIRARDVFVDDHTYDHKLHGSEYEKVTMENSLKSAMMGAELSAY